MRKIFVTFIALCVSAAAFAQSAENDFETKANDDGSVTITKYIGWDTEVVIPAKIGGKTVTAIGEEVFKKTELTSVTLPEGIVTIGKLAFAENKLTSVTLPGSVRTIAGGAFERNQITELVIPEGVTDIEGRSFAYNKLTSIALPASIMTVGSGAFDEAITEWRIPEGLVLANIALPENVFWNYIVNGRKAGTYTTSMRYEGKEEGDFNYRVTEFGAVITSYNGNGNRVRIPAELGGLAVKAIGESFNNRGIVNLLIPEGIIYIGSAFAYNKLTAVTLPKSLV
ncbi:MAG: leucine-rich repeat domain-containing protein [Treponematales bacterium]